MKKVIVRVAIGIVVIIIAFIICTYVYKYNLLKNIGNAEINFTENDNFYYKIIQSGDEEKENFEQQLYVKENKSAKYSAINNKATQRFYIDTEKSTMTVVNEEDMSYSIIPMTTIVGNRAISNLPKISNYATEIALTEIDLKSVIDVLGSLKNVSKEKDGEQKYIKILFNESNYNEVVWLDEETLLPVKAQIENNVRNYIFEKNNVTDENVNFLNADNYTLIEELN